MKQGQLWGLMASFDNADALLAATKRTYAEGYRRIDAYTPFPVHGLAEATGFKSTKVPLIVLIGGLIGACGGYFMQYYANVWSYAWNIGGKPYHSWPSFVPITFECMILCAAFGAVLGMLGLNGLPQPYHPVFNVKSFELASRNHFFLVIQTVDPKFELDGTRHFLEAFNPLEVAEVHT